MLPIEAFISKIKTTLSNHQRLVLQAEPGAGKSTAVPLALLKAAIVGNKKIIMLEPRRVAAKSIAHYLSGLLNEGVGQTVGYQVRNERRVSNATRLEIVTEGVLTRRIQQDPEISDIGLIIFDEFHERSLHADLALMLAIEVQEAYNESLKLLVMSATIDTAYIADYLAQAPVIKCPGRTFPVDIYYAGQRSHYISERVIQQLQQLLANDVTGDILVFLPGQGDIKRCIELAEASINQAVLLLPLYGSLPLAAQEKVLNLYKGSATRIIFSTNIAETSLTIEGVTTVIDTGLEKVLTFDVKSGLSRLSTVNISKASADQRAGRAGRVQAGQCIRLWSNTEHAMLQDFQLPDIATAELTGLTLELSAWGITKYEEANWLSRPPKHHFDVACQLNRALGFFDENNRVTTLGKRALNFGVEPRLSSMLLHCQNNTEKAVACLLAALLSERDILTSSYSADITLRFQLLSDHLSGIRSVTNINKGALEQVKKLAHSFANKLSISLNAEKIDISVFEQCAPKLLFNAFPDRLAKARKSDGERFLLANGRGVCVREDDTLRASGWLIVCDCDGKNKNGLIFMALPISKTVMTSITEDKVKVETKYCLDNKKENILSRKIAYYYALVLHEENVGVVEQKQLTQSIGDILKQEGLRFLKWTERCEAWLARAEWLSAHNKEFPTLSEQQLLENIGQWLIPYISHVPSLKALKQLDIYDLLVANLDWQQQQILNEQAPINYLTPSNKTIAIRYDAAQGPTVAVVLQEMFGQLETPMLAGHTVPLRFELLSPARRPIQTTSDLAHFWQTSYFDVVKDMRGKYPKHRWPEKPLDETPGRSVKAKKTTRGC
ncbi:ATP-dependent helicase HrpB [Thalassotalea sediminis]|uniref:ATP-dependent helicase HrpB n=1 Tax=Thalassotalea sediminis TaxID=1759089 RepID=UPI002573CED5|nr:ATP-dependent helicase HrpB [Thalassotalea sediminis]